MSDEAKPAAPKPKYGFETYECMVCDGKQSEPKGSRTRASQVRCRQCGGTAYPIESTKAAAPTARHCRVCGTKLRSTNSTQKCSLCGDR